jgi:hypothetical protein
MTDNYERLATALLTAVIDDDNETKRAVSRRIDAAGCWPRVAHFLAGYAAGQREAHLYRLDTGRCLHDDTETFAALPALTAVA